MAPLSERAAGKWQLPAFAVALVLLILVGLQIKSPDRKFTIEEHLSALDRLNELGLFKPAIDQGERLLLWPDLDEQSRAALSLTLARAHHGRWAAAAAADKISAEDVIFAYDRAQHAHAELAARDERNIAGAYEHLRRFELAAKHHALAAELAPPPALADRARVIQLSTYPLQRPQAEIDRLLDEFIEDAADQPEQMLWALAHRIESMSASEDAEGAGALLERFRDRFADDALQAEFAYLLAVSHRGAGRYDDAERVLRELLNRLGLSDPVYPKAGWLLGSVVMFDGRAQRPEEAIAIFRDVIASRSDRVYAAASRVAMAEALAGLQRYEEAIEAYREAVEGLPRLPYDRHVNRDTVRMSLSLTADGARDAGLLPVALTCEALALGLVDEQDTNAHVGHVKRLADLQIARARELMASQAAEGVDSPVRTVADEAALADARALLIKAGEHYVRLAWLNTLNEQRASEQMWMAASLFDEAGDHDRAIGLLRRFVAERSDAEIIPRVLLRLGRSLQAEGRYAEAVEAYQRNISTHPRSPFANAAFIPLAECLMALGRDHEASAEQALRRIIDDSIIFTPAAPEYRDAMFLLADLISRQGRHEEAIATLDEFLQRYPDDTRRPRALFLLAHAYFKSAQDIQSDLLKPEFGGERKRLEAERRERLGQAATSFNEAIARLEAKGESALDDLERTYLQDARLYEAACLFEQGAFREALALYERAAWRYKESPASLGAYVQVINCDLFLGRHTEAETALRRAQFLVDSIAEEQFAAVGGLESREEWRRYFDWVAQTLREEQ
jgi:tetratricopeptide (TPR) repeat protein